MTNSRRTIDRFLSSPLVQVAAAAVVLRWAHADAATVLAIAPLIGRRPSSKAVESASPE